MRELLRNKIIECNRYKRIQNSFFSIFTFEKNLYFVFFLAFISTFTNQSYLSANSISTVEIQQKNNGKVIRNKSDFISLMSYDPQRYMHFSTKEKILEVLNKLLLDAKQDYVNSNPEYAHIFNILLTNKILSPSEKNEWIDANVNNLPSPIYLLKVIFLGQEKKYKEAGAWYNFALIRLFFDSDRCLDSSAGQGVGFFFLDIVPLLDFGVSREDPEFNSKFKKWRAESWEDGVKLHKTMATNIKYPYWIANHGIGIFIKTMNSEGTPSKQEPFLEESKWGELEEKILNEFNPNNKK